MHGYFDFGFDFLFLLVVQMQTENRREDVKFLEELQMRVIPLNKLLELFGLKCLSEGALGAFPSVTVHLKSTAFAVFFCVTILNKNSLHSFLYEDEEQSKQRVKVIRRMKPKNLSSLLTTSKIAACKV